MGPELLTTSLDLLRAELADTPLTVLGAEGAGPFPGARFESVGRFDGSEASAGRVSGQALRRAVQLCLAGEAAGVVTGPVHKGALHVAGFRSPGQTELLGAWAAAPRVGMLMCAEQTRLGGPLRVLLATTHVALRRVPDLVTVDLLVEAAALTAAELAARWGIERPSLGLCAMNPHASDGGLFGDEEARVFTPAVEAARARGIQLAGPIPADTVFHRALQGEFDAIIAPYHDVGMAAFKTAAFGRGVNVTLGLPFVRTSPDHGTAFDLVGSGRADPSSFMEAIQLARRLSSRRF
ncbi:MAG: 4-hydroxythreonine-4-phosphate dehydrogenase PdxA [Gemmatimonadota bacterium]